ncbi:hypothetical protein GCM10007857_65080 [Bradyrhizobium iriomotense]|uniref:Uncharacterized protein n=2 Tax=Bradyrhizobium iriomotense TaxID=441950 RepID=A0ABQ6B8Q2_9BRAD|nr:hypothetical protein GCM10007857_65080 [Bradyrhizobium iriomotense]
MAGTDVLVLFAIGLNARGWIGEKLKYPRFQWEMAFLKIMISLKMSFSAFAEIDDFGEIP